MGKMVIKKFISFLLAITAPIWILPVSFILIIFFGMLEIYKQIDRLLWINK
jgi:hypothetical protein